MAGIAKPDNIKRLRVILVMGRAFCVAAFDARLRYEPPALFCRLYAPMGSHFVGILGAIIIHHISQVFSPLGHFATLAVVCLNLAQIRFPVRCRADSGAIQALVTPSPEALRAFCEHRKRLFYLALAASARQPIGANGMLIRQWCFAWHGIRSRDSRMCDQRRRRGL